MPQALAAVPYIAAVAAGAKGVALAAAAVASMVFGALSTFAMQTAAKRGDTKTSAGHLLNGKSTQAPIPIVYGTMRVGGNQVYVNATGNSNENLHIVQTISEGEIDSIVTLHGDDKNVTAFGDRFVYEFFNGAADQAVCASLQAADPTWNDPLRNTAYIYAKLIYEPSLYISLPVLTATVKGIKVYDPRTSATAWSNNPALCIYDFMLNARYGLGIDPAFIDEPSVEDFANWCDTMGYECNCVIDSRESGLDIVGKLLASCRGFLVYTDGKFYLRAFDYDSPVMDLTEDDIKAESFSFTLPGIQDLPNSVRAKFINSANKYVLEDLVVNDTASIGLDGETREKVIELIGVDNYEQAYKIALYQLERARLNRIHSFACGPKAIPLEPGDMIRVTHTLPGWTQKVCRVLETQLLENSEVYLEVVEEDEALYDDEINVATHGNYVTNLPDPLAIPPPPSNVSFLEESYSIKDNTFSRLKISWTPPANYPFLDYVEVWVSRDGGTSYFHHNDAVGSVIVEPVKDGESVYIKLRSVSTYGRKNELANIPSYFYTVTGKSNAPDDVDGFQATAAGDTVLLRWDEIGMEDLAGYEVRYGASWGTSLYFGFTKGQMLSVVGVKPGIHSFCIKAKDTLGNYSESAAVSTVTVFDPPGYSEVESNTPDYETEGMHNGTEYYNDPIHGDSLRVDPDAGLSGDYMSPSYDLGSKQKCRHWLEYVLNVNATGATWEGGVGDFDWEDVFSPGETWIQQLANVQAGTFRAKLFYSDDGSNWSEFDHFEIFSIEVDARYVRFQLFIANNDPESYIYVEPATIKSWWR